MVLSFRMFLGDSGIEIRSLQLGKRGAMLSKSFSESLSIVQGAKV